MIDWEIINLRAFAVQRWLTGHATKVKRVNSILGTCLFRGYGLNMIDYDTLNSEPAARGSRINLAASQQGTAKVNWIWAPVGSEVTDWTWLTKRHQAHNLPFKGLMLIWQQKRSPRRTKGWSSGSDWFRGDELDMTVRRLPNSEPYRMTS